MKVCLINGSPNEKGCTYTALKEVADTLNKDGISTEIFWIGNAPIHGYTGVNNVPNNDIVAAFKNKAESYDGFIFGSPVYYASMCAQLKAFMESVFPFKDLFYMKPAAAIVSCRRGGATATFDEINKYFTIRSMLVVGSQYWNQVHGNTPEEVVQDIEGMQTMRTLGHNMAWILKCIELGDKYGVQNSSCEKPVRTNFIK